jgi:hypothetical protein
VFLLLALPSFPIWVSFHSSVIGNLLAVLTGTQRPEILGGAAECLWGAGTLAAVFVLVLAGGYRTLERVQLLIVALMLFAIVVSLVLLHPDWTEFLSGLVVPRPLEYPAWLGAERADIAKIPVWVEVTRYAGVIGGASYDYLAYVGFLREKAWGSAHADDGRDSSAVREGELARAAADPRHPLRVWLRAPLVDSLLSFAVVIVFTAVFVAAGAVVLAPAHEIPDDTNFLGRQVQFLERLHPWLGPLYYFGAFLTILGTLYGTIEVAPAVVRELVRAFSGKVAGRSGQRLRLLAVSWCCLGALSILLWRFGVEVSGGTAPRPTDMLTPANLFTGVLSCDLVAGFALWQDRRFLPPRLRMPLGLRLLAAGACAFFIAAGLKGYWDFGETTFGAGGGWHALWVLAGTVGVGAAVAPAIAAWGRRGADLR